MEKYDNLKSSLKRNPKLTEEEKQIELKNINEKFSKEKKDPNQNLY